jgi:hypothetical protein
MIDGATQTAIENAALSRFAKNDLAPKTKNAV